MSLVATTNSIAGTISSGSAEVIAQPLVVAQQPLPEKVVQTVASGASTEAEPTRETRASGAATEEILDVVLGLIWALMYRFLCPRKDS